MRAAGQRLLPHHGLLRGARPPRRLLRASQAPPLSRQDARRHARWQRLHRRVLSFGALNPLPASSARPRHAPPFRLCALHPAERCRGATWAQCSRLSSLCSDDGRAGARTRAASASPWSHHRVTPFSPSRAYCRSRATCQALSLRFAAIRPKWRPSRRLRSCLTRSERFAANGVRSKTRDADRGLAAGLRDAGGVSISCVTRP